MRSSKKTRRKNKSLSSKKRYLAVGMVTLLVSGGLASIYYLKSGPRMDTAIKKTLENIATVRAYTHYVETETTLPTQHMHIIGTYHVNSAKGHFYSLSTTTITALSEGSSAHTFTLHNIVVGDDIYTKIETESDVLQHSIPHGPLWRHFKKTDIPPQFNNIAVPGPILNNLRIFSDQGKYLTLVEKGGVEQWENEHVTRYTFRLSRHAFSNEANSILPAVVDHIGKDGLIDVWVDEEQHEIRHMRFENPPYRSTTTITNMYDIPSIIPPPEEEIE